MASCTSSTLEFAYDTTNEIMPQVAPAEDEKVDHSLAGRQELSKLSPDEIERAQETVRAAQSRSTLGWTKAGERRLIVCGRDHYVKWFAAKQGEMGPKHRYLAQNGVYYHQFAGEIGLIQNELALADRSPLEGPVFGWWPLGGRVIESRSEGGFLHQVREFPETEPNRQRAEIRFDSKGRIIEANLYRKVDNDWTLAKVFHVRRFDGQRPAVVEISAYDGTR
jgi:hypothetical protein